MRHDAQELIGINKNKSSKINILFNKNEVDEQVPLLVPKSKLEKITNYLLNL